MNFVPRLRRNSREPARAKLVANFLANSWHLLIFEFWRPLCKGAAAPLQHSP